MSTAAAVATPTDAIGGSRRWTTAVFLVAILAALMAVAVNRNVFPYDTGDHDEPVYRYQAQMLADGKLTIPRSQEQFFRPWLSGPQGHHLVLAFPPGWPAILMMSQEGTGSTLPALGLSAAVAVLGSYLAALELTRRRGVAAVSAILVAASPFMLLLGGTHLNYVLGLGVGALVTGCLLRARRTGAAAWAVGGGVAFGFLLVMRPFDAILALLPVAIFLVATSPLRTWLRLAVAGLVGLAPFLAITALYNRAVTGSATTFSATVQSGGWAAFGFGDRSVAADTPRVYYSVGNALSSLAQNVLAVPTWLVGAYLVVPVAVYGFVVMRRAEPARAWLILGMVVSFPLGYVFWWASALTVRGAYHGLGPHYLVPMAVPMAILATVGAASIADWLHRRRRHALVVAIALSVAVTAAVSAPKLDDKSRVTTKSRRYSQAIDLQLRDTGPDPTLVVQARSTSPYLMRSYPFIANPPDLAAPNLFALDRGAAGIDLLRKYPDRRSFRIVDQLDPGDELHALHPRLIPLDTLAGDQVAITARITNRSDAPTVIAYARYGSRRFARVIDTTSRRDRTYEVTWLVSHGALVRPSVGSAAPYPRVAENLHPRSRGDQPPPPYRLTVGAALATGVDQQDPDRSELRYYARTRRANAQIMSAPEAWTRIGSPTSAWLPITVDRALRVDLAVIPGA